MDKRYQVFVSSTFTDLEEERKHVIQTLMEMDCIPAGMELFPAIDEEQWEFIKKIIDDCDYYLLIIGGRYGTVADDGISYTEKEFDYAISKGLKVTVLIHENPEDLPIKKSERDPALIEKLEKFIEKTSKNRLRRSWSSVKELPGLVSLSMQKTIKTYPAVGWVRADKISNESALAELNELRKQNSDLHSKIIQLEKKPDFEAPQDIASLTSKFKVNYVLDSNKEGGEDEKTSSINLSWETLFFIISPFLKKTAKDDDISEALGKYISTAKPHTYYFTNIDIQDIKTIHIQFKLLGLLEYNEENWVASSHGKNLMMNLRAVRD